MWMLVSVTAIAVNFAVLLRNLRCLGSDRISKAVILLIWLRLALSALGEPALNRVAAGQSLLALGTVFGVLAVLLLMPLGGLRGARLVPFGLLAGLVLLSAVFNGQIGAAVDTGILWAMFIVIAVLVHRALRIHGLRPVLGCLLVAFALPVALQLASVAMGRGVVGADGSVSYMGNYVHEAVFSTVALCALWLVTVFPWRKRASMLLGFAVVTASMLLANYRTLILACLPLLIALVVQVRGRAVPDRLQAMPLLMAGALAVVALMTLPLERFAEVGLIMGQLGELAKPPEEFTAADKDLLSARLYIAALYLREYIEADLLRHLIGFGPAADTGFVGTHPHNEFLRLLFETGITGLTLWVATLCGLAFAALRRVPAPLNIALAAGYAALVVGSFGTSFFIRPEGIIFVALLVALTWYHTEAAGARVAPRPGAAGRPR